MTTASTRIVAIIPARGGSQGIPRKNLQPLGGKPLLAHSIEAALACPLVERVVVSTDDEEIAEAARRHGAETPVARPEGLAGGRALVGDVVRHVVEHLAATGWKPFAQATLYPTHPFRPPGLLDLLLGKLLESHDSVITVRPVSVAAHSFFVAADQDVAAGGLRPLVADPAVGGPYPAVFHRAYGLLHAAVLEPRGLPGYAHEVTDPAALVDIDEQEDLLHAEAILRRGLFRFANAGGDA